VCSTLLAPANVRISGDSELRWDPVEHARSYSVESRYDKASTFEEIGEIIDPVYRLRPEFQQGHSFRVRSLRAPYEPSLPSRPIALESNDASSIWCAIIGGFLFFIVLVSLYFYSKYGNHRERRKKKFMSSNGYVCPSSFQPYSENSLRRSINLVENALSSQWHGSKSDSALKASFENEVDFCFSEETPNAIDDMLREKYMFGAQNVPVQLMNDLRIERLRREFRQSHL
ncbi:hypothetical protein Angca_000131, partial [Angiostrongylus cantonensis]